MADRSDVQVLVGMSGVGKSFRARELGRAGALVIDCDAEIAGRLVELVTPEPGEAPVLALGRWMGLPSSEGYRAREARYLALESEVTASAARRATETQGRVVIDTTGSVVHLGFQILEALRAAGRIMYLRSPVDGAETMLARYLAEPKPVVFGEAWIDGEPDLAAAYRRLLSWRAGRYATLADETITVTR